MYIAVALSYCDINVVFFILPHCFMRYSVANVTTCTCAGQTASSERG